MFQRTTEEDHYAYIVLIGTLKLCFYKLIFRRFNRANEDEVDLYDTYIQIGRVEMQNIRIYFIFLSNLIHIPAHTRILYYTRSIFKGIIL